MNKQPIVVAFWNETALPFEKFQQFARAAETDCRKHLWHPDTIKCIGDSWYNDVLNSAAASDLTKKVVAENWQNQDNPELIARWSSAVQVILLNSERSEQEEEIYSYLLRHMRGQVRCAVMHRPDNADWNDVPEEVLKDSLWEMVAEQYKLK